MNNKRTFFGIATKGRFVHRDPDGFELFMKQFEDGYEMQAMVQPKVKRRTCGRAGELSNQNGYYFGVQLKMIGDEIGEMDLRIVDNWVQIEVGNIKIIKDKIVPAGTKFKEPADFQNYCKKVSIWASSFLHLYIPDPHESEDYLKEHE